MAPGRDDDGRRPHGQRQRLWDPAASPTHHHRAPLRCAHHGVVDPPHHVAVVQQEAVGDSLEPRHRPPVGTTQRLLGKVARGHHQRWQRRVADKLDVERGGREHHAEILETGGDALGDRRRPAPRREDDRRTG